MALQTLTSSAPQSTETVTATSSTDPPGTTDDGNPGSLGRNSIPFSFLVAFLALFVAFMGIGLFARRLVNFVRLQLGLPVTEPRPRQLRSKRPKPVLWDVYPEQSKDICKWRDMDPLSGWFLRENSGLLDAEAIAQAPAEPISHAPFMTFVATGRMSIAAVPVPPPPVVFRPPSTHLSNRLPTRNPIRALLASIRGLTRSPVQPDPLPDKDKPSIESLRVAVLVAMPSEERRWREKASRNRESTASSSTSEGGEEWGIGQFGEMSLGIADVPWTWPDSALDDGKAS
ncbi:hypothetical protein BC835DRAFT_1415538 [Cytidiella melzeri]|nr:hypothetical protein BC835DRAFT_1415538 [Cytidiella melzeri]